MAFVDNSEYIEIDGCRYRKNVGIILYNKTGKVLLAERKQFSSIYNKKGAYSWQFPQGGVDRGETTDVAVMRELFEETGVDKDKAKIVYKDNVWRSYTFPAELKFASKITHNYYKNVNGQIQKWFLIEFLGSDSDIKIPNEELNSFKWVDISLDLVQKVVPFKRIVYKNVIKTMKPILQDIIKSKTLLKKI